MSQRHTVTATVITALVVLTLLVSGAIALAMSHPRDPIDQYLDEVRDLAVSQTGERPSDDDGRFNTTALLGGTFTCGLRDEPLFADAAAEAIETNALANIASRYCDTVFNDDFTDEERAKYGVQLLGAPATEPSSNLSVPAPSDPARAATDAKDAVKDLEEQKNQVPNFTGYTCEPNASAKFDDPANPNVITNKDCAEINAEKEQSHREYAEQTYGDAHLPNDYCDPFTKMQLDGTPC